MNDYKDIVREVLDSGDIDVRNHNDDILLISTDQEYTTAMNVCPGIMVDVRPNKNILIVSCNFWKTTLMMKLAVDYLLELRKHSLPEPKEIYILDVFEASIGIGFWNQVFEQSPESGYVEQLMYRCRELTDNTTVSLVNADINSDKSSIIRKAGRFDNYYSFPFGILYRTKAKLLDFKTENSTMDYQVSSKHFICMNAKINPNRINLVNYLHKEKIVDSCHLSWLAVDNRGNRIISVINDEACFDYNKPIVLDVKSTELRYNNSQETVDKFYYLTDSLIDIGIETLSDPEDEKKDIRFITEKTWKPFLFGKIGFQFNYSEYYSDLKTFGFELYDEIFDYSFDKIKDNEIRFKEYCNELKRISEISIKDLTSQILTIEEKILNNRNHAWNYKFPIPTVLKEYPNLGIGLNINNYIVNKEQRTTDE